MGLYDVLIAPFFFFAIWLWARSYTSKHFQDNPELSRIFKRGLWIRIIGSLSFAMVYQFYYQGGDTMGYFAWVNAVKIFFLENPIKALSFIFTDNRDYFTYFYYSPGVQASSAMPYTYLLKYGSAEVFFIKIASFVNVIGLFSYIGTSMVFAVFSFYASWRLYILFLKQYKHLQTELSLAILLIPSVVFWGSGLMKDTLTFSSLCFVTVAVYDGVIQRKNLVKNIIYILVFSYLIMILKGYIILAFIPAASFWVFNAYKDKISNPFIRFLSIPILLGMSAGLFFVIIQQIGNSLGKFSVESLQKTALGYQQWHTMASEHGSGYTLGTIGDFSTSNIIKTIPKAINVTLFRPYLTESRNAVLVLAAIESLIFLLFTIYLLVRSLVYRVIYVILNDTNIQFCLIFSLTFAFSVGFTSYNFGALVRYKIPCMPFYAIALILVYDQIRSPKKASA